MTRDKMHAREKKQFSLTVRATTALYSGFKGCGSEPGVWDGDCWGAGSRENFRLNRNRGLSLQRIQLHVKPELEFVW